MSRPVRFLTTAMFIACSAGAAMAQMSGGGMGGSGSTSSMMSGAMSAQMMGGQMMKSDMMSGMAGTMLQMQQVMEKMAGSMGQAMDTKKMSSLSDSMDDLAGMMTDMAARMRSGKMDDAMLARMNARMAAMNKVLDAPAGKGGAQ